MGKVFRSVLVFSLILAMMTGNVFAAAPFDIQPADGQEIFSEDGTGEVVPAGATAEIMEGTIPQAGSADQDMILQDPAAGTEDPFADPAAGTEDPFADPAAGADAAFADPAEAGTGETLADPAAEAEDPAADAGDSFADPEVETGDPFADPAAGTEDPNADPAAGADAAFTDPAEAGTGDPAAETEDPAADAGDSFADPAAGSEDPAAGTEDPAIGTEDPFEDLPAGTDEYLADPAGGAEDPAADSASGTEGAAGAFADPAAGADQTENNGGGTGAASTDASQVPAAVEEAAESAFGDAAAGAAAEADKVLTWEQYKELHAPDYADFSKEEILALVREYENYRAQMSVTAEGEARVGASSGSISNTWLDVSVGSNGRFSIGNKEGNPNYSSDNGRKLIYGYPDTGTSTTLLNIDGYDRVFEADSITYKNNVATATMYLDDYDLVVTQRLEFISSGTVGGSTSIDDCVRIEYKAVNTGTEARSVGIRIMLDTMLASNDDAPFKVKGTGNVTRIKNYDASTGIPESYQVYDDLTNPTTIATGYLVRKGETAPDRVQFTNWGGINDDYWSYVGTEGDSLGDSAVGIYWDPVSLSAGGSRKAATYYGVGVGSNLGSTAGASSRIGGRQVGVEVVDDETGDKVKDAEVTMNDMAGGVSSGTTDENGFVLFDLSSEFSTSASFTIKADGHEDTTVTRFIKGGDRISITLKGKDPSKPSVTGVTLDGQDVMNNVVHYIDNSGKNIERAKESDIKKIQLVVTSDQSDCVYYLLEDNSVVAKNTTGVFELKTVKTKSGTVIDSFSSGGIRQVYCVSKDGTASRKIKLGIKVSIPSVAATTIKDINLWPYSSKNLATGTLGALLLGDSVEFGLKNSAKLKVEVGEDGKVKVSYNLNSMPNGETAARIEQASREFETSSDAKWSAKKVFGSYLEKGDRTAKLGIPKHIEFDYGGYGEGIIEDGKVNVSLAVIGTASVSASYTVNYFYVVPLYITVSGTGSIEVQIIGSAHLTTDDGRVGLALQGSFNPSVSVGVEGGVGSKGIANLGVEGRGTLSYTFTLPAAHHLATLTGEANLKFAVWKFEKSLNMAKATVKLLDSEDFNGSPGEEGQNLYEELDKQPFRLKSRDYMENEQPVGAEEDADYYRISENVSADAEPVILSAEGKKYKFWIDENMDRTVANGSELMYSVYEDGGWSEAAAVDDDGTADFSVNAAYDGSGRIYVVWENSSKVFDDSTVTVDEMGNAQEICLRVLDLTTGSFGDTVALTQNQVIDAIPAVAAENGTAYVVWNRIEGSIEAGTTQSALCTVSFSGGTASAESVKDIGTLDVSELSASMQGRTPVAVYTVLDLSQGIDAEQKTYTLAFENGMQADGDLLSSDGDKVRGALSASLNGEDAMFWYQDGNICYRLYGDTQTHTVFADGQTDLSEFTVADAGGRTYVIWKSTDLEDASSAEDLPTGRAVLYAADYRDGAWTNPYLLTDCGCDYIHGIHAEVDEEGRLVLTYIAVNYGEEGAVSSSEMVEQVLGGRSDAVLTDLAYDPDQASAGQPLPLTLTVRNDGTDLLDEVELSVEGGEETYTKTVSGLGLRPGESGEIQIDDFAVSASVGDGTIVEYSVNVQAAGDEEPENGSETMTLGYTHLTADQLGTTVNGGRLYYPVSIRNRSRITARNVMIKCLADSEDGTIIYDTTIEEIAGGDSMVIYVPEEDLEGSSEFYVFLSSDTPADPAGGQYTRMVCSDETLRVLSDVNVDITAGEGGSIQAGESGAYLSGEEISLTAAAAEGYIFDRWEADRGTFEDESSESTVFYVPEEDAAVKAVFVPLAEITGLRMEEESLTLRTGTSGSLAVAADQAVTASLFNWDSDHPEIAKVSTRGRVTGLSAGTAVITASLKNDPSVSVSCQVQVLEPEITNIRMVYPRVKLTSVGEQKHLKVDMITEPAGAEETAELAWESDHPEIVSVDEDGTITAKAAGTAVITVRPAGNPDGVSAECAVTVSLAVESIAVKDESGNAVRALTLNKNEDAVRVTASALPQDIALTEKFSWTANNEDLVSIETEGENDQTASIRGLRPGRALITVSYGDKETSFRVDVKAPATGITLSSQNLSIRLGDSASLSAQLAPEDSTDELTWETADSSIAYISGNTVYTRSAGTTTITAKAGSVQAACRVRVYTVPATAIKLSETKVTVTKGESHRVTATLTPSNSTDEIEWSSSNSEVASVSGGYIYTYKVGTAKITAKAGKVKATCTVTVQQKQYPTVEVSSAKGFESDYTDAATHTYSSGVDKVWKLKTTAAVRGVRIKFDNKTEFENSYDYLEVLDRNGEPVPVTVGSETGVTRLTGTMLQGKTISITALPVRIHMHTDGSVNKYGFKVSAVKFLYNLSKASASLAKTSYTCTGKAIQPAVTVKSGGTVLKKGTDYTVTYKANTQPGTASVVIKGKSPNNGSKTLTFRILPKTVAGLKQTSTTTTSLKLTWTKQTGITGYKVYKYAASKYTLVKTIPGAANNSYTVKSLKAGTAYSYAVAAYKTSGSATLLGSKKLLKVYTCPVMGKPTVTAGTRKAVLKWKRAANASGYEVYASDQSASGFKKAATVAKGTTLTATINNLTSKKKKYFKVRAYIKTASGNIYSAYSSVVSCTVK